MASNENAENIKNLELLGRIWGFLKYYHPKIAKGNYNWDYELFRFLPKYIEAKNDSERNELIINWITSLGQIDKGKIALEKKAMLIEIPYYFLKKEPLARIVFLETVAVYASMLNARQGT